MEDQALKLSILHHPDQQVMIRKQIIENDAYSNELFLYRVAKLKNLLQIEDCDGFLDKDEENLIDKIIVCLNDIILWLQNDSVTTKEEKLLQKYCRLLFEAVYHYIHHRPQGIRDHLSIEGIEVQYKKDEDSPQTIHFNREFGGYAVDLTFAEYQAISKKEIDAFFSSAEIQNILLTLDRHAKSLFWQRRSADEFLFGSRNSFDSAGARIGRPLFIKEISECLGLIEAILNGNHANKAAVVEDLSLIVQKMSCYRNHEKISEIIRVIYGSIEMIAHYPAELLTVPLNFHQKGFLRTFLGFGLCLAEKIPYALLEISEDSIEKAKKILANSKTTQKEKEEAIRILVYAPIPWRLLRNIGLLLFNSSKLNRPQDEEIVFGTILKLIPEYISLLPLVERLIEFEIMSSKGKGHCFEYKELPLLQIHALTALANYGGDIAFLNKIKITLENVDFKKLYSESFLRIFEILGEVAKNLSPEIKKVVGGYYWLGLAKLRDKIAHSSYALKRVNEALRSNQGLKKAIINDFQLLFRNVNNKLSLTYSSEFYEDIKVANEMGEGFEKLLMCVTSLLTESDYDELMLTMLERKNDLEENRDKVLAIINGKVSLVGATREDQESFFKSVDALTPIPNGDKKKIKEYYKNLKQNKSSKLSQAILDKLKAIQSISDDELRKKLEELISILGKLGNRESLLRELNKYGLSTAIDVWESKRQKLHEPSKKDAKEEAIESPEVLAFDEEIKKFFMESAKAGNGILAILKNLKQLTSKHRDKPEEFWENIPLCLAAEHCFVRIRVYIAAIEDAISHLKRYDILDDFVIALNDLYRVLNLKLTSIRLYGNFLAHLHDVSTLETRTSYGLRLSVWQEVVNCIDGFPFAGGQGKPTKHLSSFYNEIESCVKILESSSGYIPPAKKSSFEKHEVATNTFCFFHHKEPEDNINNMLSKLSAALEKSIFAVAIGNSKRDSRVISIVSLKAEAKKFGYDCKDMELDGNCFFHALLDQLKQLDERKYGALTSDDVRAKIVQHLIDNIQIYCYFLAEDADSFMEKISQPGEWADHIAILASAYVFGVNIAIIQNDGNEPVVIKILGGTETVVLGYEVGLHYQSLYLNKTIEPSLNLQEIIERKEHNSLFASASPHPK